MGKGVGKSWSSGADILACQPILGRQECLPHFKSLEVVIDCVFRVIVPHELLVRESLPEYVPGLLLPGLVSMIVNDFRLRFVQLVGPF